MQVENEPINDIIKVYKNGRSRKAVPSLARELRINYTESDSCCDLRC